MLVTLSRSSKSQPVKSEEMRDSSFPSPEQPDSNPTMVGFAPEQWTVHFKNITSKPIRCFGHVEFTESHTLQATSISKTFLSRMLRQTMEGLGLSIEFSHDKVTLNFSHEVKQLIKKLKPISVNYPLDFKYTGAASVKSQPLTIELAEATVDGNPEVWPALKVRLAFDQTTIIFERDEWIDADVRFKNLCIDAHMALTSVDSNYISILKAGNKVQGNFPVVPTVLVETTFKTDLDAVVIDSNVPGLPSGANLFIDLFLHIEKELTAAFEAFQLDVSRYIQLGIHMIADKEHDFCGLGLSGSDWRVLTGPIFEEQLKPEPLPPLPLADKTPIDGPQSDTELTQLNRIKHIVVLMMENRSYDHVLGHLSHPDYGNDPRYNGLTGDEENIISGLDPATPAPMQTTKFSPSPPHGFPSVQLQINNGKMDGFGSEFRKSYSTSSVDARSIMNFHVPGQLQIYDDLVKNYTVATQWFSALPGGTFPNRLCAITGHAPILENDEISRDDAGYLEIPSVFDLLTDKNVSWRYYEHDLTMLRMMKNYRLENDKIRHITHFNDDANSDDGLPSVTFIDPNFSHVPGGYGIVNDDHPGGADMTDGQNLIESVLNSLKESNGWDDTMLIITYDEHGGFFDHVPPPGSAKSQFKEPGVIPKIHPNAPAMLGVRVPAFIVSPRAEPGEVIDRIFDHTSILKTILARFLPGQEHLLGHRVEKAAHLGGAVSRLLPQKVNQEVLFKKRRELTALSQEPLEAEEIERGSFHDVMKSFGNPLRLSREKIESMIGRLP